MKKLIILPILLVLLAKGMDAPNRTDYDAQVDSIFKKVDEELHLRNSFLDAFMDPSKFEFSRQGMQFKHYEDVDIKYSLSWDLANKLLNNTVDDVRKLLEKGRVKTVLGNIGKNYLQPLTEVQKYEFQLIHSTFHFGNLDLKNADGSTMVPKKVIYDRNRYRDAFAAHNWKEARKYSEKKLNLAPSFPNLSTRIHFYRIAYMLQDYLKSWEPLAKKNKIWEKVCSI